LLDPSDHCGREIYMKYLLRRRWMHEVFQQSITLQIFQRYEGAWFIDVGASYGMYSLLAAESALDSHIQRVVSIEGSPITFDWLQRTFEKKPTRWKNHTTESRDY
jgi:hypothetical protein